MQFEPQLVAFFKVVDVGKKVANAVDDNSEDALALAVRPLDFGAETVVPRSRNP